MLITEWALDGKKDSINLNWCASYAVFPARTTATLPTRDRSVKKIFLQPLCGTRIKKRAGQFASLDSLDCLFLCHICYIKIFLLSSRAMYHYSISMCSQSAHDGLHRAVLCGALILGTLQPECRSFGDFSEFSLNQVFMHWCKVIISHCVPYAGRMFEISVRFPSCGPRAWHSVRVWPYPYNFHNITTFLCSFYCI